MKFVTTSYQHLKLKSKIMSNTIRVIITIVLATSFVSCQLGQAKGNGNVITEERSVTADFEEVKGSNGIDIFLTKGAENKIVVEADENLQNLIETNISNGKLTIRSSKNIGRASAKKVHVTYVSLTSIEASGGADVIGNSVIRSENLSLKASSGADLEVNVFTKNLTAETSSGADLVVTGKAITLDASASSGSELNAKRLQVITCSAKASSGADITVDVKDKLNAKASSGGDIKYFGDPASVSKNDSSSGSIRKM